MLARAAPLGARWFARGAEAADVLEAAVLGCFERRGAGVGMLDLQVFGSAVVTILLNTVGLEGQIWRKAIVHAADDAVDVQGFVHRVVAQMKRNSIILAFSRRSCWLSASI